MTTVPFVGRAVPWVPAGVGAVATQSWTVVEYGVRGPDLMEDDVEPTEARISCWPTTRGASAVRSA